MPGTGRRQGRRLPVGQAIAASARYKYSFNPKTTFLLLLLPDRPPVPQQRPARRMGWQQEKSDIRINSFISVFYIKMLTNTYLAAAYLLLNP
jgi:hypothetical protein